MPFLVLRHDLVEGVPDILEGLEVTRVCGLFHDRADAEEFASTKVGYDEVQECAEDGETVELKEIGIRTEIQEIVEQFDVPR